MKFFEELVNFDVEVHDACMAELKRQRDSLLYERLTLSQDKDKILELSEKGQILKTSKDLINHFIYFLSYWYI